MSLGYEYPVAADARAAERAAFIRRTYGHLAGAVLAFIALEAFLLRVVPAETVLGLMLGGRFSWIVVLLLFMGVSWVADQWARSSSSPGLQYLGLGLYVVAEAVIFLPLLIIAEAGFPDQHLIAKAGILTGGVFGGLTLAVLVTRHDFSGLRTVLAVGSVVALALIVASAIFRFDLGLFFCFAMVALASGYIIYQTSNVLHYYHTDQHVAAALALFASVALLFWYILQILMLSNRRS
jgi:FtsH-binding integral membrane protein